MKEKMSLLGIGPSLATYSIIYGTFIITISYYFYPVFQILFLPQWLLSIFGVVLILIGILTLIISVKTIIKGYNSDSLVTEGIYKCCRHPLYSAWIVFIVPGIILLVNSWIGLSVPLFMYFLLRKLVLKEERYLEDNFGAKYIDYKIKTPFILPLGCLKK